MLNINRDDVKIKELKFNNGTFTYNFDYKGTTIKGSKILPAFDEVVYEEFDNLLEIDFVNVIRKQNRGYGDRYSVIRNLDLIDEEIEDTIKLIDIKDNERMI